MLVKNKSWMRWIGVVPFALTALFCALASPCLAQPPMQPNLPQIGPRYENLVRLNIGVGFYDSGWYNCNYFYPYYACTSGNYGSYIPFTLGAQAEVHLGNTSYISPGVQAMTGSISGTYFSGTQQINTSSHITLWEPTLDYVGKFGSASGEIMGRFRVGGALYFGSDGGTGGGFRTGVGGSFFNTHPIGLGLDLVLEGGSYRGSWLSGIQLLISPEFRF